MAGSNKILTVSYGTFSCTVEGFEDSFGTMRAIAEYFRDLAADDRYFGAEPPTPDAEMLQRLLERETHRRIEAQVSDNGITLRPTSRTTDPDPETSGSFSAKAGGSIAAERGSVPKGAYGTEPPKPAATSESLAEKLARIRAVVDKGPEPDKLDTAPQQAPWHGSDTPHAGSGSGSGSRETQVTDTDSSESDTDTETPGNASETEPSTGQRSAIVKAGIPSEAVPEQHHSMDESPSEISQDEALDALSEQSVPQREIGIQEGKESERSEPDARVAQDAEDRNEAVRRGTGTEPATSEVSTQALDLGRPKSEACEGPPIDEASAENPHARADASAPRLAPRARIYRISKQELAASLQGALDDVSPGDEETTAGTGDSDDEQAEPASDPVSPAASDGDGSEFAFEGDASPFPSENTQGDQQEKRNDPDSREADEVYRPDDLSPFLRLEDDADADWSEVLRFAGLVETGTDNVAPQAPDRIESPDAESQAHTMSSPEVEVSAFEGTPDDAPDAIDRVIADESGSDAVDPAGAEEPKADVPRSEPPEQTSENPGLAGTQADEQDPEDVERLLDRTNDKMDGQDTRRRRSAIEHLKAAFKAARAEGTSLRGTGGDEDRPYRDDLARISDTSPMPKHSAEMSQDAATREAQTGSGGSAPDTTTDSAPVHPKRPTATGGHRRPEPGTRSAEAPTPLVLVSDQRSDESADIEDGQKTPVRPRRVRATETQPDPDQPGEDTETAVDPLSETCAASDTDLPEFWQFVDDTGAAGLEDLLECAAAFSQVIEGRPHFTHPQLLEKVRTLADQSVLRREDSLCAFGRLLRHGMIRKRDRGQFTLSHTSRFITQQRSAVG